MSGTKRTADDGDTGREEKRVKTKKQWRVPRKNDRGAVQAKVIQPGDSGIWVTCNKGKEGKCVSELRDLFADYADLLYGEMLAAGGESAAEGAEEPSIDIESEINAEVAGIRKPTTVQLFTPVQVNVQCVVFFKTVPPVEPVSFVKRICEDATNNKTLKRTRFAKRLSPMTLMGRASPEGLEKVGLEVLAPYFHQEPMQTRKFAIRPTMRNHDVLSRDSVIKQLASIVGPGHQVDLKNYELLVVVEIYQNVCGISVVDSSFEKLKRFNLSEIYDPTLPPPINEVKDKLAQPAGKTAADSVTPAWASADVPGLPMGTS